MKKQFLVSLMKKYFIVVSTLLAVLLPMHFSYADSPFFDNLTATDVENIVKDFAAVETFTSVSPASVLGDTFGFEGGLIFGAAKVPNIEDLVHREDPTKDVTALPQAALLGAVSVPYGVKFELGILPEKEVEDVKLSYQAFAIQWTFTKDLLPLPVDMALKIHRTTTKLKYTQDVSGVPTDVSIEDTISGLQYIVSKNLAFFEPYAGLGVLSTDGELAASANIFATPTSSSMKAKVKGSQFFVGFNASLAIFKLGVEVGKVYESTKASLKLSAAF